jgi:hypothetical protein
LFPQPWWGCTLLVPPYVNSRDRHREMGRSAIRQIAMAVIFLRAADSSRMGTMAVTDSPDRWWTVSGSHR